MGTGENINFWNDPWIATSPNKKVISPRNNSLLTKVSDFISPITGHWDENLLSEHLYDVDVFRILQIPINTHGFEDFISWHYTKHGRYSVVRLSRSMEPPVWG